MKIVSLTHLAISSAMAAMLFAAAPAFAQGATPALLGVVDTEQVLEQSLAGKAVKLDRERFATAYQNQFKDTQGKLRAEEQELTQQRGVMAPDVFQQKATAFQQKMQDFQNQVRDKEERLEYASNQAVDQIVQNLLLVSQDVAKERGLNAVIARQTLLVFEPGMDITKPVLDKLNVKLPAVQFQNPDTLQRNDGQPGAPTAAAKAPAAAPAAAAKAKK